MYIAFKSSPNCGKSPCLCGALELACFSWRFELSADLCSPLSVRAPPLRSPPAPHPRGPPLERGRTMSACHDACWPEQLPGQNTASRSLVHVAGPVNKTSRFRKENKSVQAHFITETCFTSQWAAPVATVKADGYVKISAPCLCKARDSSGNLRS